MHSHQSIPPASPHAGQSPSAADRSSELLGKPVRVRVAGRQWYVHPTAESLVRECHLCNSGMARRVTCGFAGHRVCTPCFDGWIKAQQEDPERDPNAALTCSDCRQPLPSAVHREIDERSLALELEPVRLLCAECLSWAGPLTALDEHARRCQQKEVHPCRNLAAGCDWQGLLDDLDEHDKTCDWRQVACGHGGCPEKMPLRHKAAHEAGCSLRPVRLGQLETTAEKWQQLQDLRLFCQQGPAAVRDSVPEGVARQRLQETVTLMPLLFEALSLSVPDLHQQGRAASSDQCGWCCAFTGTAQQVAQHLPHCPAVVRDCPDCGQKMPRRLWSAHVTACPRRIVPCPHGCGEANLRADAVQAGIHDRSCVAVPTPCRWCHMNMDARLKKEHEAQCDARLSLCTWCLGYHKSWRFDATAAECRTRLPTQVLFGQQPLRLHDQATGPVYIQEDSAADPVWIRLPVALLRRELGSEAMDCNLTKPLRFTWAGAQCRLDTMYCPSRHLFTVTVNYGHSSELRGRRARVALYSQDGRLLERLGDTNDDNPDDRSLLFTWTNSTLGTVTVINRLTGLAPDAAVFLQLGPFRN